MMTRRQREAHAEAVLRQIARNDELEAAYVAFVLNHGREPSHRELWAMSPPPERLSA